MQSGERRLACVVRSNTQATDVQIAEEVKDRKVSEYTVHHSLLRMGLHSRRPVRVPMLIPFTAESTINGHVSIRTGPWSNGRRWPGLRNLVFFYITWMARCMSVLSWGTHGTRLHHSASHCLHWPAFLASQRRQCDALGNALLGNQGTCHPCGCYFDTSHLPQHCCRTCTPVHGNSIPCWLWPLSAG